MHLRRASALLLLSLAACGQPPDSGATHPTPTVASPPVTSATVAASTVASATVAPPPVASSPATSSSAAAPDGDVTRGGVLLRPDFRGDRAVILGLRLGQTWGEARKIVQANPELEIQEDPGNPGRFYVNDKGGEAGGDRALFYCQWPGGITGMGRLVIYPRIARFLRPGETALFLAASAAALPADVKTWLGPEDRSVVSLDIPSIGLKLTDHVYEKHAMEVTDYVSRSGAPHVYVNFVRPELLSK